MPRGESAGVALPTEPQPGEPADEDAVAAARSVVRASRILSAEGLVEAFGHVSARLSRTRFVLTPRKGLSSVSPDDLLHVEVRFGAAPTVEVVRGDPAALPVEAVIHAAVYMARPEVGGIVRDHGEASTVLGITGAPLRPIHALGAIGPAVVPVLDTPRLVADWSAGEQLARTLGGASALLLRGNGRVVVGSSVEEACARAILLEESARIQLAARSAGLEPRYLTAEEMEDAVRDLANPGQVKRVWDHYCAKHGVDDATA
ncbi:MAG TPA: class II aldolase/adducin family protein [Acidimicrobiales bacterium]|nr:class II aldolase/adducin family protein [Acidimicrobiales bacterium]